MQNTELIVPLRVIIGMKSTPKKPLNDRQIDWRIETKAIELEDDVKGNHT